MSSLPTYLLVIAVATLATGALPIHSGGGALTRALDSPASAAIGRKDPPKRAAKPGGTSKKKVPAGKKGAGPADKARTSESASRDSARKIAFRWPVKGRKILEPYGERVNPVTGTVTMNPGINIAAPNGTAVVASASGSVSLVSWLPGYATFVIVEHTGGYRTVYANLGAASVTKGRRVKGGDRLGRSTRGPSGEFVHFEIWRGQIRVDPVTLLPRK